MANRLSASTSPYLLQHAHNPVDWFPWCEEAWDKARNENKLVLISIGYSACHWCHVMERESFENSATAQLMNERYVCIKVDREERPDIDQVYMSAVQLMSGQGGWPLNCFTLPDARPLYGGTYFPNPAWNEILVKLDDFYRNQADKALQYADELTSGLRRQELIPLSANPALLNTQQVHETVKHWKQRFDPVYGGPNKAPKFPLPDNYQFLLHYGTSCDDEEIQRHVHLTLDQMAMGGIFDQIGGGFARYSVDAQWKVPHFEKMLYDNAQLVSLYANAYKASGSALYKVTLTGTLSFIDRELLSPDGVCYSALDADSEGEEGKFYTWTDAELRDVRWDTLEKSIRTTHGSEKVDGPLDVGKNKLNAEELFRSYYHIDAKGLWEHGRYIPLCTETIESFASKHGSHPEDLRNQLIAIRNTLLAERSKRIRPGLDDKVLLSWNALMITAWCDAYDALKTTDYKERAIRAANWLLKNRCSSERGLTHSGPPTGVAFGPGFLEDHAHWAIALLALYRITHDESWLGEARRTAEYALDHFSDPDSGLCWFTSDLDSPLITRQLEIHDNVIASSNSVLARALFLLSHHLDHPEYRDRALQMTSHVQAEMPRYGAAYSGWAQLLMWATQPFYEIVVVGPNAEALSLQLRQYYLPHCLITADTTGSSNLPLFRNRTSTTETSIHICTGNTCLLPVYTVEDVLDKVLLG